MTSATFVLGDGTTPRRTVSRRPVDTRCDAPGLVRASGASAGPRTLAVVDPARRSAPAPERRTDG